MKEQIVEIMRREGITANKLATILNVQPSSISHIMAGRNRPGYDFIMKLIEEFPSYNVEWLLTGRGEVLRSSTNIAEQGAADEATTAENAANVQISESEEQLESSAEHYARFEDEIIDNFRPTPAHAESRINDSAKPDDADDTSTSERGASMKPEPNHDFELPLYVDFAENVASNGDRSASTAALTQPPLTQPLSPEEQLNTSHDSVDKFAAEQQRIHIDVAEPDAPHNVRAVSAKSPSAQRIIVIYDDHTFEELTKRD